MLRTRELRRLARRLIRLGLVIVGVLIAGTIAFAISEKLSVWEGFRWSLDIVATVGSIEHPETTAGEITSTLLIILGVGTLFYALVTVTEFFVSGHLAELLQERRLQRMIDATSDHFIICGYGRVGRQVADEFRAARVSYVVLDFREDALAAANEHGDLLIEGDATEDHDLTRAGIERAAGIVVASDNDADNLYITLSARSGRPELTIVARASDEDAEKKLKLAGADRVVTPFSTAGRAMANLVLKPQVAAFLDVVTTAQGDDFVLEEIEVRGSCPRAGRTIRELRVRDETGAMIVALRKGDGTFDATPSPDALIDVGDVLIGVGTPEEIRSLEDFFAPQEAVVR